MHGIKQQALKLRSMGGLQALGICFRKLGKKHSKAVNGMKQCTKKMQNRIETRNFSIFRRNLNPDKKNFFFEKRTKLGAFYSKFDCHALADFLQKLDC